MSLDQAEVTFTRRVPAVLSAAATQVLLPWKPRQFQIKEFSDVVFEFEVKDGQVTALKRQRPSGEDRLPRR
jgi:hypothetical protein